MAARAWKSARAVPKVPTPDWPEEYPALMTGAWDGKIVSHFLAG